MTKMITFVIDRIERGAAKKPQPSSRPLAEEDKSEKN
jgi:hypothetical protein